MLKITSGLFALLAFTLPARAETVTTLESCHLNGRLELHDATQIICLDDLEIEDGAVIVTAGHELQILVSGRLEIGTLNGKGLLIRAADKTAAHATMAPQRGAPILIQARAATGRLAIDNQGRESGGDITLEYGSTYDYDQSLSAGNAAATVVTINGEGG
jgi:hypothetical protein